MALVNLQYQFIEVLKNVDEWTNKHCQTEALIKSIEEIKKMVEKLTIVTKADSTVKVRTLSDMIA